MAFSYSSIEKKLDRENRIKEQERKKQEKVKRLEETIKVITAEPWEEDFTAIQVFLINYFGVNEEEVKSNDFGVNDYEGYFEKNDKISEDELEVKRYNSLVDIIAMLPDNALDFANESRDIFHKEVKDWETFTESIETDNLIVKKLRNLQILNMLAHKFNDMFYSMINYKVIGKTDIYSDEYMKKMGKLFKGLCSPLALESESCKKQLLKTYNSKIISEVQRNSAIKDALVISKWMFKQKADYLVEILNELEQTNGEYNYGKRISKENGFVQSGYTFDVPGYGQFSVHKTPRDNRLDIFDEKINEYNGNYLDYKYLLYKADEELIKKANLEELSDKEKQLYNIIKQEEIWRKKEKYQEVRKTSSEIKQNQESLNTIKLSLKSLKEDKEKLKKAIKENEEKMLKILSENDEHKDDIVQSIKELQKIIKQQKVLKERIKKEREELKGTKKSLKKVIIAKESSLEDNINELEL